MAGTTSIDLKQLRYFVGVVDCGSITKAAATLNIAQPALTNRMAALERNLGVKLLFRSPQGVRPTQEGEVLYVSAKRILRELETLADEVRSLGKTPVGIVRFACVPSSARVISTELLDEVMTRFPSVRFAFSAATSIDIYQRLLKGDIDLALMFTHGDVGGLARTPVLSEEMLIAVSSSDRRWEGMGDIELTQLSSLEFVMVADASPFGMGFVHRRLQEAGVSLNVVAEIHSLDNLPHMILDKGLAAVVPWSAVHEREAAGKIRLLRLRGADLTRELSLCKRADQPTNPAMAAVADVAFKLVGTYLESGRWRFAHHAEKIARTVSL